LFQIFWHWRREFPSMGPVLFSLLVCAGLCFGVAALFYAQTERVEYISSAFPQNLMMSVLFIQMFYAREDARGQSLYIAVFKLLGTGAAMVMALFPLAAPAGLYATTFCGIFFFDLLYVFLLHAKLRRLGIPPWRRL
ncbi:MAG TPA: hypothetical protein VGF13_00405, partial [Verrucomicrobiae bacterium]